MRSPCGAMVLRFVVSSLALAGFLSAAATAAADAPVGVNMQCLAPTGYPAPGSPQWRVRDTRNQTCATLRLRDQYANPAFGFGNTTQGTSLWIDQASQQAGEPTH